MDNRIKHEGGQADCPRNAENARQRVLMVHNFYQIGGGEHTVFTNEVAMLRRHGHEVVEYTRKNDELKSSKLKLLLSPLTTLWSWKSYREVKRLIRSERIDVVHCHNTFPLISPSVYYAAKKCKVPVFQTIHNFRILCPAGVFFRDGRICEACRENGSFKQAMRCRCYRDSKLQTLVVVAMLKLHRALGTYRKINYIFLTEFNREKFAELIDINGGNVFVKPNFVSGSAGPRSAPSEKRFVFAGRLEENKGVPLLIERWKALPQEYVLNIYGDGEKKALVEEAARQCPNIRFFGFVPQEVIEEDIRTSCGLVFPSIWYEGFPMVIAESFSCGCPVLAADLGNHGDIIRQSGGGALFDPASEQSFTEAVRLMVSDNARLSENALAYYRSCLNEESNYQTLVSIYNSPDALGNVRD